MIWCVFTCPKIFNQCVNFLMCAKWFHLLCSVKSTWNTDDRRRRKREVFFNFTLKISQFSHSLRLLITFWNWTCVVPLRKHLRLWFGEFWWFFFFNFQKNYILGIFSLPPMGLGQSATDRINSEIIEKDYVGFSLSWDLLKIRKLCNTTSLIFWFKVILHLMNQISLRPEGVWNWK